MSTQTKNANVREARVVASLAHTKTRAAALKAVEASHLEAEHFTDKDLREQYRAALVMGADEVTAAAFGDWYGVKPSADISADVAGIIEDHKRRNPPPTCRDAATWLEEEDEPDTPLVHQLIEQGEMVAVVGQSKAGKSFVALQLGVCIATGRDFLGRTTERSRVYVANLEVSTKQYKKRLRNICKGLGLNADDLRGRLYIDNMKGETATLDSCLAKAVENSCTVVIIDPFYQIFKGEENDPEDCKRAVEEMKAYQRANITLVVVFHAPKGFSGDRQLIDMISGSSILARFPESIIGVVTHATDKSCRVLQAVLRNYSAPADETIKFDEGVYKSAPDTPPVVLSSRRFNGRPPKDANTKAAENNAEAEKFNAAALDLAKSRPYTNPIGTEQFKVDIKKRPGGAIGEKKCDGLFAALIEQKLLVKVDELYRNPKGKVVKRPKKDNGKTFVMTPGDAQKYLEQFDGLGLPC